MTLDTLAVFCPFKFLTPALEFGLVPLDLPLLLCLRFLLPLELVADPRSRSGPRARHGAADCPDLAIPFLWCSARRQRGRSSPRPKNHVGDSK
jgi:hypothetical protein